MCEASQIESDDPVPPDLPPKLLRWHALFLHNALTWIDGDESGASVALYRGTSGVPEWRNIGSPTENAFAALRNGNGQDTAVTWEADDTPDLVLPPGGQQGDVVFVFTRGDHADCTITSPETDSEVAVFAPMTLSFLHIFVDDGWVEWADTFMNEFRCKLPVNVDSLRQDQ